MVDSEFRLRSKEVQYVDDMVPKMVFLECSPDPLACFKNTFSHTPTSRSKVTSW